MIVLFGEKVKSLFLQIKAPINFLDVSWNSSIVKRIKVKRFGKYTFSLFCMFSVLAEKFDITLMYVQ